MQDQLIIALDQSILAYTSGLCAVVEQGRIIEQKYLSDDHIEESKRRNEEIKNNHPYGLFFGKLRNHLLHSLSAPLDLRRLPGLGHWICGLGNGATSKQCPTR